MYNGTVLFEPKPFIKTKCYIDLTAYPNDKQSCVLLLGSFLEQVPEMNITIKKEFDCRLPGSVYECKLRETKVYNKNGFPPFVKIFIDLKRKTAFYFYVISLPYYSAVLLTLSTFFIPLTTNNSFFKLKMTMLLFALFIFFFAFSLVFNEIGFYSIRAPYIIKTVSVHFLFDAIFLILIAFLNQNIQNPFQSPPTVLTSTLLKIPFLNSNSNDQFFASSLTSFSDLNKDKIKQQTSEWMNLSSILDKIMLVIYVSILVIYHS